MSLKKNALIVAGVMTLGISAMTALEPKTPQEQHQQQVEDLSDADEKAKENMQDRGAADADANQADKNRPGEHRPPEKVRGPRIKLRIP